jgi:hypothetical protein
MMCKKFICLVSVLVLSFACTTYADVVIGDWEDGSYDSWIDWGGGTIESIGAPKYTFSETGVTLGSSALKVSPGGGWQQNLSIKLQDIGMLEAFMANKAFEIDVTYNSADWDPSTTYAGTYTLSLNAEGYGWNDVGGAKSPTGENGVVFTDTLNPDSPGNLPLTDPGTEGTTVTGTWTWDYSGVLESIPNPPTYVELIIATNSDQPGAYYFDNARLTGGEPIEPEPAPRVLLEDDFEGDTLDLSKWQLLNGPDVAITQAGGQVFFDRPATQLNYLITAEQFDPAVTPLTITGSANTGPEGLAIWTRASNIGNTADSAQHVLDNGIRCPLWPEGQNSGWYDAEIIRKDPGIWGWTGIAADNIPGAKATDWDFVLTDDGTTITVTWTQSSDPTNTFTVTATDEAHFDSNYVAFTVINGYLNDVTITTTAPPPPGPKIIYVTSVKDQDVDEVQDNLSWLDWLEAEGYTVDFRPDNWVEPLDADKIAELEAADLIIASRGMSTDRYDGDTTVWNSLSTPIICTNAWMIRSSRWVWMNSTSANKDAGAPFLLALEPTHPIFAGVPLDADGLAEILDPTVASGSTSFLTDILDVGNGTLIAQSLGIYNTTWIAEWAAGVEYYDGAGQIAGGPRMLFMAGTQDDGFDDSGIIMAVDVLNLNDAGKQLFLNAIEYILPAKLTHSYTFEDGTANDSVGEAHGTLVGGAAIADGAMVTTAQDQWMEMPGDVIDVNSYDAITIEAWYIPTAGANTGWSMLAYLGGSSEPDIAGVGIDGYFMTTARADDKSRAAISTGSAEPWADETGADGVEYDDGLLHHMVSTLSSKEITLYIDGVLQAATPMDAHNSIHDLSNDYVLLAKGGYGGDPEWIGQILEFNIYDKALTAGQIAANYAAGPVTSPKSLEVENASFELPGTEKIKGWNGEGVGGTPAEDIPGWASDTEVADSGVESDWPGSTDGVWAGYIMGADPSVWNLTDQVIGAGEEYLLQVDLQDNWTDGGAPEVTISLYYDDAGTRVTVATATAMPLDQAEGGWAEFSVSFAADDVPDSIGKLLGIEIDNISAAAGGSWVGMDNVRLSVN